MSSSPNTRRDAAIKNALEGLPVFPCHSIQNGACTCGHTGCDSPGKHPLTPNGYLAATTKQNLILDWWRQFPYANVAIATGKHAVVVDIDPRNDGFRSFDNLQEELGELPELAPTVRTGGGGSHIFLKSPHQELPTIHGLLPGVDFQSKGAYVIAPPSLHVSGNHYEWLIEPNGSLPPVPRAWLDRISEHKKKTGGQPRKPNGGKVPEGQRNDHLTSLAGSMRRRGMTEQAIFAALKTENELRCNPPLGERDVETIARSVSRYAPAENTEPALMADSRFDDIGNASRLVAMYGKDIRYIDKWGVWLHCGGTVWTEDAKNVRIGELAKGVSQSLYQELATTGHDDKKSAWARQSSQRARIEAAIHLARGIDGILISHEQLDSDPYALGIANGWIDLKTGTFYRPDPAKLMTLQSPIAWGPDAQCPRWLKAMTEWFPDNKTRDYVQRLVGQAMIGTIRDHIFVILYGDGANGKGTFIRALMYVLGPYAVTIDLSLLVETKYTPHDSATSVLFRKRLAVASETSRRIRLAEASVKNLTGGDKIPARRLYENPWEFNPTHTLWLQTNYLPEISGRDRGIWRRIRVIPWTAHFKRNKDENLDDILRDEAPGILRWCVEGVQRYLKSGLEEPDEVLKATAAYRANEDVIGRWMEDCGFTFDAALSIEAKRLTESWRDWSGILFGKPRRFNEVAYALEAAGCTKHREGQCKLLIWNGIGLND